MKPTSSLALLVVFLVTSVARAQQASTVNFDVIPAIAASEPNSEPSVFVPEGAKLIELRLDISALIDSTLESQPHEFLYHIVNRSSASRVVDYSPRTTLQDTTIGGISVEQSNETSRNLGFQLNSLTQGALRASGGGDLLAKQTDKAKFERVAEKEIVAASGTIQRGRGVYFKLRSTPGHVLDGQKSFRVTVQVPESWRADLIDIYIRASKTYRPFKPLDHRSTVSRHTRFQVAAYDVGDDVAERTAWSLAEAEQQLREVAHKHATTIQDRSRPTLFHQLAVALDVMEPRISENWLQRTIFDDVDPYFDREIKQLCDMIRDAVNNNGAQQLSQ